MIKQLTFYVLLLLFDTSVMEGQAWTKSKGTGFYKLDYTLIRASSVYNHKGMVIPYRTLDYNTVSFYGEHGITDNFTVQAYIPFYVLNVLKETKDPLSGRTIRPRESTSNFGDIDIAFRYAVPSMPFALSATILLGIPTGNKAEISGLVSGDGEFNQMIKIAGGTGSSFWWTQAGIGFNNRTKGYFNELRYDAEFGYKFFQKKLFTILKLSGIESLNHGIETPTASVLFSNNVGYLSPGVEFLYFAKPAIGFALRAAGAIKGQNIMAAHSLSTGIFAQF